MNRFKRNRVLVIGDIILDSYIKGLVSRISPEAPVPVMEVSNEFYTLGGAANVASNLASLNCTVGLIGVVGDDIASKKIIDRLEVSNISLRGLHFSNDINTIEKKRIVASNQQIIRLDYNDRNKPSESDIQTIIERFDEIIKDYDVVVISDYNKGVCVPKLCQHVIEKSLANDIKVIVDPKGSDWRKYRGATMLTPNMKEISLIVDSEIHNTDCEIERKCTALCDTLNIDYLLITRSEKGMSLVGRDMSVWHIPSKVKDVYDVSGAGDTVIATLAGFINDSHELLKVVEISNLAAGISVSKFGTSVVTFDELNAQYNLKSHARLDAKIHTIESLKLKVLQWKNNSQSVVFTNGCFDVLHKGHIQTIYSSAEQGDILIVAINSDDSVRRLKGESRPINSEYDRAMVIAAIGCVDAVIIFNEDTPWEVLNEIRPNILVKGGDYTVEQVVGRELVDKVKIIDFVDGYSSSKIIDQMDVR